MENSQHATTSPSDLNQIREVFEEIYVENVRSKNVKAYGEMYTKQALWMAPNTSDRCGRADIEEGFAELVAKQDIDPKFTAEEIHVIGDFAYVIGVSEAFIIPHDRTTPKKVKFKALWLMQKVMGSWKIDRQIWNDKPL